VNRDDLAALLSAVAESRLSPEDALARLRDFPTGNLPFASIDHHRALRTGFPEVVFGAGKEPEQVVEICGRLAEVHGSFLVTRATPVQAELVTRAYPDVHYNTLGRTLWLRSSTAGDPVGAPVCIVTAGTSDLPVSEEAAVVAEAAGVGVERLNDVGVAGIHRLLANGDALRRAGVIIEVAGMEGALPSVVGGLVRQPVIAVPTSVGYGASFGGVAALLGMLNSCAAGVTVVNVDNGFGAAMAAVRILRGMEP